MRFLHAVLFASLAACAATSNHAGPVNVAEVRNEIRPNLHDRTLVSMGHTEHDRAVIYTKDANNARHEETWTRGPTGWTMTNTTVLADN